MRRLLTSSACFAGALALVLFARPGNTQTPGQGVALQGAPALTSFTDANGQMFGAGPNVVVQLGEDGKAGKSFPTPFARAAISPHGANALVVGDLNGKTVSTLDTKTGAIAPLLRLADVKDPTPDLSPGGHLLGAPGALSGVASDGKFLYLGIDAGFSSAVFKVDPATKQILSRSWAAGSNPSGMVVKDGSVFVVVGGHQVRRFTGNLERSKTPINLPVQDAKGIAIRGNEIRVVDQGKIARVAVGADDVSPAGVAKNLDRIASTARPKIRAQAPPKMVNTSRNIAVLVTGDLAENMDGELFWNDTVWMYRALLAKGYKAEEIFVLYGDGEDFATQNPMYKYNGVVTDYAATSANLSIVLDGLKNGDSARGIPKMDGNDTLFVWTFDHGGHPNGESTICLRGDDMKASTFNFKMNAINYARRAVFMQQCFSGGFIPGLRNAKTFISTSAKADEVAHVADTEKELYNGKYYTHGEMDYWLLTALKIPGFPQTTIANTNNDAFISSKELHGYYVVKENQSETPQYADDGNVGPLFKWAK